jgi:anaerobic magnesium-protoporphyrin IX monomethyl ester cyclase
MISQGTPETASGEGTAAAQRPDPRWERLKGRKNLTIAFVSLYVIENTGIRLLAAVLRGEGVRVHEIYFKDWVTNRVQPPTDEEVALLISELRLVHPDLVGISVRASAFHQIAKELTDRIRHELDVPVLWGGMHASSCPEAAAAVADLVCIGEAETTIKTFVERLREGRDIRDTPGLWVRTTDGLTKNEPAPLLQDLDSLPFPDYHSADKTFIDGQHARRGADPCTQEAIYLIMASRGCPFPSCAFCSNSVIEKIYPGQKYHRTRSLDHVFAEIQYARRNFPHLKRFRFDDEEFPVAPAWFDEFCRRWPKEVGLPFEIHMDPRVVTEERIRRLKEAGLDMVFMGIQHIETINRELYHRNVSDEKVLSSAAIIHASKVRAGYQVILDDPVSTSEDKRKLFDLLLKLQRPYELVLFSLTVYPASALADDLKRRQLITDDDIEGPQTKVFSQFRVDLSYPRPVEDQFWTALTVLVSKEFVPKGLLRRLASSKYFAAHPRPLTVMAYVANLIKLGIMGLGLAARGELSWAVFRRWVGFKSLVTY